MAFHDSDLTLIDAGKAGTIPKRDNFRGSDLSGADPSANRVATLTNTQTSAQESVFYNGQLLTITEDYTVSHLSSSSTVTFLGIVSNNDFITARYFT